MFFHLEFLTLRINTPAGIAGTYALGAAFFGPPLSSPGITGDIVQADRWRWSINY